MNLSLPSLAQLAAFGRHVATYAAGAVTVGIGLHILTPDQGSQIGSAVTGILNGVASIAGGLASLVAIGSGLYAAWTASGTKQAAAIGADKRTLVNAGPNGTATVTLPPDMAAAALNAQKKAS